VLREKLNRGIRVSDMKKRASGVHLCGFNEKSVPEFIHFSNCSWTGSGYENLRNVYKPPFEDFRLRDAFKFGQSEGSKIPDGAKGRSVYRNGDLKVHEAAGNRLDEISEALLKDDDFKTVSTLNTNDLRRFIEFKLKFIGSFYNTFAFTKLVGAPFDIEILKSSPKLTIDDFSTLFMKPI
jgi:hypothetical protein